MATQDRRLSPAAATGGPPGLNRSHSSSAMLRRSGQQLATTSPTNAGTQDLNSTSPVSKIPKYLSVHALTKKSKLSASTGNLHGYMAEDYHQVNWPLPKMFGKEKYGYSLVDITDPRYLKECALLSKKLVRLSYDQQIVDLEWRKTYKALLDAEHRQDTLPVNAQQKTRDLLKKEVDGYTKYLLEIQEQKDLYETEIQTVYSRCDDIKLALKKERDLEELRVFMENRTKEKYAPESSFFSAKFDIHTGALPRKGGSPS